MSKTIYSLEELNAQVATLEGQIGTSKGMATAWGVYEANDGLSTKNLLSGLNSSTTAAYVSTGNYDITFETPMDNENYAVLTMPDGVNGANNGIVKADFKTINGFRVAYFDVNGGAVNLNGEIQFHVFGGKN